MEFSKDEIIAKVESGFDLTIEEEAFYMVEILKVANSREEALQYIKMANNDDQEQDKLL
ncbi:hypothetical protein QTN47_27320 [Danxiaibacter flavus]|uniref:Uncharacterized protein n=1 Tax=Danxiaibacter flavus TaxID=3049108 RepID=A0ABV3ZNQ7_9BACT|nr:hypothetical protein QNM32_27320 [Chitinophagaceae bacterium DXS]